MFPSTSFCLTDACPLPGDGDWVEWSATGLKDASIFDLSPTGARSGRWTVDAQRLESAPAPRGEHPRLKITVDIFFVHCGEFEGLIQFACFHGRFFLSIRFYSYRE